MKGKKGRNKGSKNKVDRMEQMMIELNAKKQKQNGDPDAKPGTKAD